MTKIDPDRYPLGYECVVFVNQMPEIMVVVPSKKVATGPGCGGQWCGEQVEVG